MAKALTHVEFQEQAHLFGAYEVHEDHVGGNVKETTATFSAFPGFLFEVKYSRGKVNTIFKCDWKIGGNYLNLMQLVLVETALHNALALVRAAGGESIYT